MDIQKFYKKLLTSGRVARKESKHKPKGLSAKTVRNLHQMLSSALSFAKAQRLIPVNPAESCALPKLEHREMQTLTVEQLGAFFQEAQDSGVYELYYLDLATGLRRGELLGLKWSDIDFQRKVLPPVSRCVPHQASPAGTDTPRRSKANVERFVRKSLERQLRKLVIR